MTTKTLYNMIKSIKIATCLKTTLLPSNVVQNTCRVRVSNTATNNQTNKFHQNNFFGHVDINISQSDFSQLMFLIPNPSQLGFLECASCCNNIHTDAPLSSTHNYVRPRTYAHSRIYLGDLFANITIKKSNSTSRDQFIDRRMTIIALGF